MKKTILRVRPRGNRVEACFKGRHGGAPNWQHHVDHFPVCLRAVCAVLGKTCEAALDPELSLGRGEVVEMPQGVYLATRVVWESDSAVSKALAEKTLEIDDGEAVSELAIKLARAHHAALITAAKMISDEEALAPSVVPEEIETTPDVEEVHAAE